jgi:hypothetical protein
MGSNLVFLTSLLQILLAMTPSLSLINLLKGLIELREILYVYQFITRENLKGIDEQPDGR